jgi:hypothetical protein
MNHCGWCGENWPCGSFDPAILLDLIERAEGRVKYHPVYMSSVKSYLKGDPSALKKLAGAE